MTEIVEEIGYAMYGFDNNISQTATSIDQIMADTDAIAAWHLAKPRRPPARETSRIHLKFGKQRLLPFDPREKCRDNVHRTSLRLFRFPCSPFLDELRFGRQGRRFIVLGGGCLIQIQWAKTVPASGRAGHWLLFLCQLLFEMALVRGSLMALS